LIALISSVPFEQNIIQSNISAPEQINLGTKKAMKGTCNGLPVILLATGIGKVNAAHVATIICEQYPLQIIVNFGVGGAYPDSGLEVGQIAVATSEIYGDEGVIEPQGWHDMEHIGIPVVEKQGQNFYNKFSVDPDLVQKFQTAIKLMNIKSVAGPFVTVSTSSGTTERALELESRFGGICENMEGAALAHICAIYNVSFVEIRGISNIVENRNKEKWDLSLASLNCQKALLNVITKLTWLGLTHNI
jgi:futalosine hydrolase